MIPKTILIAGTEWRIKVEKKEYGGGFSGANSEIVVGTKIKKMVPTIFLHEVVESIMTERCCRYSLYSEGTNEGLLFSFNHKEFEMIIRDLAIALKDVLHVVEEKEHAPSTEASKEVKRGRPKGKAGKVKGKKSVENSRPQGEGKKEIQEEARSHFLKNLERHCMEAVLEDCQN